VTKAILKSYFNNADFPNETQFSELIDAIPGRIGFLVAAADAPTISKEAADYICDGTDDNIQIQAALDALPAVGGIVYLSPGTFTKGNIAINIAAGKQLKGSSRSGTIVAGTVGNTAGMFTLGDATYLGTMTIMIPVACTNHAISGHPFLCTIEDLTITGGTSATKYAIYLYAFGDVVIKNINMSISCNGMGFEQTFGWGCGGLIVELIDIVLNSNNRVAYDIFSLVAGGYVNFCQFNYITCAGAGGIGAGCIGLRIRNSQYMTFIHPCLETLDTSIYIEGQIAPGTHSAQHNTFIGPWCGGAVVIKPFAFNTVFIGGILFGTVTDTETTLNRTTEYYGTSGAVDGGGWIGKITATANGGAATPVADGGIISHGLQITPTWVIVSGSVAGEICTVSGLAADHFHVDIKKHDGTPGTAQTIYWRAEV
jgi:hypothetical protein